MPTLPTFHTQVISSGHHGPGPRSRHCLVHDGGGGATVLFGGILWSDGGRFLGDTWELHGGRWALIESSHGPPARHRGAMAYDQRHGFSVLFGGQGDRNAFLDDTWVYADRRWQQRRWWWRNRPEPRCGHAMTFDETLGEVVLFGGISRTDRPLKDTWLFNGKAWREVRVAGPPARRYAAFAYDPSLGGCVLHGGAVDDAGHQQFGDTWLFRERTWTRLPASFDTDVRDDHAIGYHRRAERLLLLEGLSRAGGPLVLSADGWRPAAVRPALPHHQCSPLAWDDVLDGLVLHGGEAHHGGPQFESTWLLRLAPAP